MRKSITFLICIIVSLLLLTSCQKYSNFYDKGARGVTVVNNSSMKIKSIAINNQTSCNAEDPYFEKGASVFFEFFKIKSKELNIEVTDSHDKKHISQNFTRDFYYDAVYYIYIVDTENGGIEFTDKK